MRLEHIQGFEDTKVQKFQFHKGAIRTKAPTEPEAEDTGFNSIKVRLEQKTFYCLRPRSSGFNSIKVRLELLVHLPFLGSIGVSIP